MRRPFVANRHHAIAIGLVLFVAGLFFLYDAYERRGRQVPRALRPFLPI